MIMEEMYKQSNINININRKCLNQPEYENDYSIKPLYNPTIFSKLKKFFFEKTKPSKDCMLDLLFKILPFISVIKDYKIKYIFKDIIGGVTIGAMQIAPSNFLN